MTEKKKKGRRSVFSDRLVERLLEMAKKGAIDDEMAEAANITVRAFRNWKGRHKNFAEALQDAKDIADDLVEQALYQRATGYNHKDIKFFCDKGRIISEEYIKHYPPDTTACIFWLKNRQKERWRDKTEVDNNHKIEKSAHQLILEAIKDDDK